MTSASFAASPAKEARLAGVPNPIVTYDTYQAAAKTAGFAPLYLTKDAGYSCNYISLISKDTADLGFQKLGQTSTSASARCPRKPLKVRMTSAASTASPGKTRSSTARPSASPKRTTKKRPQGLFFIYSSLQTVRCRWRRGW